MNPKVEKAVTVLLELLAPTVTTGREFSVPKASKAKNVPEHQLYAAIHSKRLIHRVVGSGSRQFFRITLEDIDAWLESEKIRA